MTLALVLQSEGKIKEANKWYKVVMELEPDNILALNNLAANLADHGGNLDEALAFAQNARRMAPDNPTVADTLGWVYYKKELFGRAFPLLEEASGKLRKNPSVRFHYGMVLLKKGKKKKGLGELKTALSLSKEFNGAREAREILKMVE